MHVGRGLVSGSRDTNSDSPLLTPTIKPVFLVMKGGGVVVVVVVVVVAQLGVGGQYLNWTHPVSG